MTVDELCSELRHRRIRLKRDGNLLQWRSRTGPATDALLEAMEHYKPLLLKMLAKRTMRLSRADSTAERWTYPADLYDVDEARRYALDEPCLETRRNLLSYAVRVAKERTTQNG